MSHPIVWRNSHLSIFWPKIKVEVFYNTIDISERQLTIPYCVVCRDFLKSHISIQHKFPQATSQSALDTLRLSEAILANVETPSMILQLVTPFSKQSFPMYEVIKKSTNVKLKWPKGPHRRSTTWTWSLGSNISHENVSTLGTNPTNTLSTCEWVFQQRDTLASRTIYLYGLWRETRRWVRESSGLDVVNASAFDRWKRLRNIWSIWRWSKCLL